MLIRHHNGEGSRRLRGKLSVDIIVIHKSHGDLSLGHCVDNLRALLIHLSSRVVPNSAKKLLRAGVAQTGTHDGDAGLQVFAASVRDGDLVLPFRICQIEQRGDLVRLNHRRIDGDDPKSP